VIQRLNRAQCTAILIAFGLALFAFGRWIVTVGSSHARTISYQGLKELRSITKAAGQ
jgi:glucose dehydrogenase